MGDARPNKVLFAPINLDDTLRILIRNGDVTVDDISIPVSQIIDKIGSF